MADQYAELAGRIGLGHSTRIAGLFRLLCDDDIDADLLLALPGQPAAVAAKLGLSPEEGERRIQRLFRKGLVFPSLKTDPPTYRMCHDLLQFHDATLVWPEAPPELLASWRDYMENEWYALAKNLGQSLTKPQTRVIPVGVAIPAQTNILNFDSVAEIINQAEAIAVTPCTCRLSMGKCDRPLEVCIQVNNAARYTLARGSGRALSKPEALDMLRQCEEAGLIHVTMNRQDRSNFICNCCPCCCQALPVMIEGGIKVVDPSRFQAVIDAEACSGCGLCHDRCYFGAISYRDGEGTPSLVDPERCMGCGLCLVTCPEEAITLSEVRDQGFVPGAA
ncbi:MAG: 4Fe-4S binding protein [Thermodesulfobacteriota bacterium]